ncbi:hypothetical protein [Kushneria sinocarnis]|uniref:hypothetical protein n=1 Tax=Kushneria sinocarnis TaxID=595502 RepID=UPI0014762552|nr:hypothetical protein [Kushneria sinocarnis]
MHALARLAALASAHPLNLDPRIGVFLCPVLLAEALSPEKGARTCGRRRKKKRMTAIEGSGFNACRYTITGFSEYKNKNTVSEAGNRNTVTREKQHEVGQKAGNGLGTCPR